MKAKEVSRGMSVMFGEVEAVVLTPRLNNVEIQFMLDGILKVKRVSYDNINPVPK